MKLSRLTRLSATICIGVACAMMTACASAPATITPDQLKQAINNAATLTQAGCTVVQPTLAAGAVVTANPVAGVAAGVNGIFCAAQTPLIAATVATPTSASSPVATSPTASAPVATSTPSTSAPVK